MVTSTGPWEGVAEQGFQGTRQRLVRAWEDGSSAVGRAARALEEYADVLERAQKMAQSACGDYNAAVRDTNAAVAEHNSAVAAGVPVGDLRDPGEHRRSAAVDAVAAARHEVEEAGSNAAASVRSMTSVAPVSAVMQPPRPPLGDGALTNKDGAHGGGPAGGLPTDPAALQVLLERARAMGLPPKSYAGLLQQSRILAKLLPICSPLSGRPRFPVRARLLSSVPCPRLHLPSSARKWSSRWRLHCPTSTCRCARAGGK